MKTFEGRAFVRSAAAYEEEHRVFGGFVLTSPFAKGEDSVWEVRVSFVRKLGEGPAMHGSRLDQVMCSPVLNSPELLSDPESPYVKECGPPQRLKCLQPCSERDAISFFHALMQGEDLVDPGCGLDKEPTLVNPETLDAPEQQPRPPLPFPAGSRVRFRRAVRTRDGQRRDVGSEAWVVSRGDSPRVVGQVGWGMHNVRPCGEHGTTWEGYVEGLIQDVRVTSLELVHGPIF